MYSLESVVLKLNGFEILLSSRKNILDHKELSLRILYTHTYLYTYMFIILEIKTVFEVRKNTHAYILVVGRAGA